MQRILCTRCFSLNLFSMQIIVSILFKQCKQDFKPYFLRLPELYKINFRMGSFSILLLFMIWRLLVWKQNFLEIFGVISSGIYFRKNAWPCPGPAQVNGKLNRSSGRHQGRKRHYAAMLCVWDLPKLKLAKT